MEKNKENIKKGHNLCCIFVLFFYLGFGNVLLFGFCSLLTIIIILLLFFVFSFLFFLFVRLFVFFYLFYSFCFLFFCLEWPIFVLSLRLLFCFSLLCCDVLFFIFRFTTSVEIFYSVSCLDELLQAFFLFDEKCFVCVFGVYFSLPVCFVCLFVINCSFAFFMCMSQN